MEPEKWRDSWYKENENISLRFLFILFHFFVIFIRNLRISTYIHGTAVRWCACWSFSKTFPFICFLVTHTHLDHTHFKCPGWLNLKWHVGNRTYSNILPIRDQHTNATRSSSSPPASTDSIYVYPILRLFYRVQHSNLVFTRSSMCVFTAGIKFNRTHTIHLC